MPLGDGCVSDDTYWGLTDPLFVGMDIESSRQYFRLRLWLRDEGACGLCGRYVQLCRMDMDHVIQKTEGGPDHWDNLRVAHIACNRSRPRVYKPVISREPLGMSELALTVDEAAGRIGTTVGTVRRWVRDGRLKGVKPGGNRIGYRIPSAEVDRLLGLMPAEY